MLALLKSSNDDTEDHQIVNENPEINFGLLSVPGFGAK